MKKLIAEYTKKYNNGRLAFAGSSFSDFIYSAFLLATEEGKAHKAHDLHELYCYLIEEED
jgi:hypothetical protein